MFGIETNNALIKFAMAWASLGGTVQEQVTDVVKAHGTSQFEDVVCEQNPRALALALERLERDLSDMKSEGSYDAHEMLEALKAAGNMHSLEEVKS